MARAFPVGIRFDVAPIPSDPVRTTNVPAGAVTFGVEYREVDLQILEASYGKEANAGFAGFDERGISIHVLGSDDGLEYLRFDCFDEDPHYHYISPSAPSSVVVPWDIAAFGEMLPWVLEAIKTRLPDMLREARAPELAAAIDPGDLENALAAVTSLIAAVGNSVTTDAH